MIDKEKYYLLGSVIKAFGIKGEIAVFLDVDMPDSYKNIKHLFLAKGDELTEFKVKSSRVNKNVAYVGLEGINTMNDAEKLAKQEVWMPIQNLPELKPNEFYLHDINGYNAIDINAGAIGKITEILEYPQQRLFKIQSNNNTEILIPIRQELIDHIDKNQRTLYFNTPDGFLDIYLNPGKQEDVE